MVRIRTDVGNSSEQRLEQIWPDIHRLVWDADNVDALIADDIEDDVAAFGKAPVAWMDVVSLTTREGILCEPLESTD